MKPSFARLLIRAYPPAWRRRYGTEYAALLEDVRLTPSTIADAVGAGVALRARSVSSSLLTTGGPAVTIDFNGWHARTFALLAILVALPTTVVLALSGLAYNLNVSSVVPAIDAIQRQIGSSRVVYLGLMAAPVLAFVIAVLPVLRFSIHREGEDLMISFAIRGRGLTLVAVVLSLLLIAFFAGHNASELVFGT